MLARARWPAFLLLLTGLQLPAGVGLVIGEPFGRFGFFNPTGHAAVYLARVCAESPLRLRPCGPGEPGVVISRYNRIGGYDWLAIPVIPYLYAVERVEEVPQSVDRATAARLRDAYRRRFLREIVPDSADGRIPGGDWIQLVGAAYDRTLYMFVLETTPEQDLLLIERLNAQLNRRRFNIFTRNCADFARDLIHFYYPGAIRRNVIADWGITTPKQAARALVRHARRTEVGAVALRIPQVEGARASRRVRGVSESLVRSKKYLVPLAVFQPWAAVSAAAAYVTTGRFNPQRQGLLECPPETLPACLSLLSAAVAEPDSHARSGTPAHHEPSDPLSGDQDGMLE